jgi:hypothetical protein
MGGEVGLVSVSGDDLDGMWGAFQKGVPFIQGPDDCEKLFIINLIINLGWVMLPCEIYHRVENIVIVIL